MFSRVFLLAACDPSPYGFWQSGRKNPQLIPTTSTSSTKALERWEDKHARLLIASYMKFKDEFGKLHIIQQSIRSNFWFGRVPVRVVSDWSVRYNGRHTQASLTLGARGFSCAVSGFGQVSGLKAFSTGHFTKKVTCARKSGPRVKPLDQSAIPLKAPSQLQARLYQNIQKLDVLLIGSLEMSNVSNALIGLQSQ